MLRYVPHDGTLILESLYTYLNSIKHMVSCDLDMEDPLSIFLLFWKQLFNSEEHPASDMEHPARHVHIAVANIIFVCKDDSMPCRACRFWRTLPSVLHVQTLSSTHSVAPYDFSYALQQLIRISQCLARSRLRAAASIQTGLPWHSLHFAFPLEAC